MFSSHKYPGSILSGEPGPQLSETRESSAEAFSPVLVVDDRLDKRQSLQAVLEELPLRIVMAASGVEALRCLLREEFSVILLDLNMPEMDGVELAGLIRARRRTLRTPVIFYTADADSLRERTEKLYALGAVDVLTMPVSAHTLRAKVAVFADFHRRLVVERRTASERERLLRAEAARAEAERASAAKDHFLAMLSHELRTPLSPVLNTVELMLEDESQLPIVREQLETIRRNVALEARLIDDLLDLTRVSRGKVSLYLEALDLHECVRSVIQICAPEMEEKQVTALILGDDIPVTVRADAARLKQIFWNLVRNAVKFSDAGGQVTILARHEEAGHICVSVRDTGRGISAKVLPGIFDAFRQAADAPGGLGLGLAITRSLVHLHGGTIEARSDGPGLGSVFTVCLPVLPNVEVTAPVSAAATVDAVTLPAASEKKPTVTPPNVSYRIPASLLLVEDHADTRNSLAKLLRRRGYEVETAADMQTALSCARTAQYDIIVSDLGLPDGSGFDFIAQLPPENRLRAIALSGFGMEADIARSRTCGFARHLVKPVNLVELDTTIQNLLRDVPSSPGGQKDVES